MNSIQSDHIPTLKRFAMITSYYRDSAIPSRCQSSTILSFIKYRKYEFEKKQEIGDGVILHKSVCFAVALLIKIFT